MFDSINLHKGVWLRLEAPNAQYFIVTYTRQYYSLREVNQATKGILLLINMHTKPNICELANA